jgi:hypothetical protein
MAISKNYEQSESLGIRRGEFEKNIRSKTPAFPEVLWASILRSGRAE